MILPYNWKERIRPANLRETINRNSAVVSIVAAVVIIVVLALSIRSFMGGNTGAGVPTMAYFYDTSNQTISVRPTIDYPPLPGATGKNTVVLAYFYTCTTCADKKLVYLQKYSSRAKKALQAMMNNAKSNKPGAINPMAYEAAMSQNAILVRSPAKGSPWVPLASPQGQQVTMPPNCAKLKVCMPN